MKVVHKDLQALGVDHESVKKFLKYKEADAKVGDDPYASSTSEKATKTKAYRALHKDLSTKTKNASAAINTLSNIHDYKGKDALYENMMSFKSFIEVNELSNVTLASYKKKAGEQASAADKAGDFKKGNKRFSGIVKATKKQFANPVKEDEEDPCWDGYKQLGMKDKNGKKVPNCIPESEDDGEKADYVNTDEYKTDKRGRKYRPHKIKLESVDEQFDVIEEMVMSLAEEQNIDPEIIWEDFESVDDVELFEAAVDAKGHKSSTGGLTQKGRDAYNAKGGNLQAPVTTPPSKLKPGSKAANRRKSFCARMGGMEGAMEKPNGEPTRKALALRKWNC